MEDVMIPAWMRDANCQGLDTEMFFDPAWDKWTRMVCENCRVRLECERYADTTVIDGYTLAGMWGGRRKSMRPVKTGKTIEP